MALLSRVLHVSRSGFYAWRKRSVSPRAVEDQRLMLEVSAIHEESCHRYRSPRLCPRLRLPQDPDYLFLAEPAALHLSVSF